MTAGRDTRTWRKLAANIRARHNPCSLCGQPIDYTLPHTDPDSFTVDHIQPFKHHPELREEPSNLAAAHSRCNKARGAKDINLGLGNTSEEW